MLKSIMQVKPVGMLDAANANGHSSSPPSSELKRSLTAFHLILLGIGAVIGAGIFVITGQAAANFAGPAVVLSFVLAGIACAFAGLCYAEFGAMLPVSGSAYSYAYATMGEGVAWLVGWCLVLEYLFASSSVAVAWSAYMLSFLTSTLHLSFPAMLADAPIHWTHAGFTLSGALCNVPAMLIVAGVSGLCYVGVTQSAFVNAIVVAIKIAIICLFIAFSVTQLEPTNWTPFIPANDGVWGHFGWSGVLRAGSVVFFAFIGFDAVSTAAGETKDPQRNMPIGILGTLIICSLVYVLVSAALTGLAPYQQLDTAKPVATALEMHPSLHWLKVAVEISAIAGLSSVILVMLMGQSRITYTIARDGLIPAIFGEIHPRHQTPYKSTIIVGILAALLAGFVPLSVLGELVSMGTLFAFTTVCIGVMVLRHTMPTVKRPFRVPLYWLVCPLGSLTCFSLFVMAFVDHWGLFISWIILGAVIYFGYGIRNSQLYRQRTQGA